jgi:hypothetical protein
MGRTLSRLGLPALLALVVACGGAADAASSVLDARLAAIEAQIEVRTSVLACVSDADCGVLGLGALACGGPARHRVYSARVSGREAMESLAAEHQRLSAQKLGASGALGVCTVVPPPAVGCVQAVCTQR